MSKISPTCHQTLWKYVIGECQKLSWVCFMILFIPSNWEMKQFYDSLWILRRIQLDERLESFPTFSVYCHLLKCSISFLIFDPARHLQRCWLVYDWLQVFKKWFDIQWRPLIECLILYLWFKMEFLMEI